MYEAESVQPVFCGNNSRFARIAQIYAVCVSEFVQIPNLAVRQQLYQSRLKTWQLTSASDMSKSVEPTSGTVTVYG